MSDNRTMTTPPADRTPRQWALARAVSDIDDHVAKLPWDGPVHLFALIRTAEALASDEQFAAELPGSIKVEAEGDPEHLTSVEQDQLPEVDELEDLLARIAWPEAVAGAAIVVERIVLPPEAEAGLGPEADASAYLNHPQREDVRMVVGVLCSGETWSVLRMRHHEADVMGGENLVPGLAEALLATFD